ncbi:hypothetical protein ACJX0J_036550, partial [Zea mays]
MTRIFSHLGFMLMVMFLFFGVYLFVTHVYVPIFLSFGLVHVNLFIIYIALCYIWTVFLIAYLCSIKQDSLEKRKITKKILAKKPWVLVKIQVHKFGMKGGVVGMMKRQYISG